MKQEGQAYRPVGLLSQATRWQNKQKAENVLRSCINKNLRPRYHVDLVPGTANNFAMSAAKEQEMINIGATVIEDGQIDKWAADIDSFATFIDETETRRGQLDEKLSSIDKQITDICHYIEFGKYNAYQGWLITNMLRNRLQQRRKVKNELLFLHDLMRCNVDGSMIDTMKNTMRKIKELEYKPRVLSQLFNFSEHRLLK